MIGAKTTNFRAGTSEKQPAASSNSTNLIRISTRNQPRSATARRAVRHVLSHNRPDIAGTVNDSNYQQFAGIETVDNQIGIDFPGTISSVRQVLPAVPDTRLIRQLSDFGFDLVANSVCCIQIV
jgi:hypothetical protein